MVGSGRFGFGLLVASACCLGAAGMATAATPAFVPVTGSPFSTGSGSGPEAIAFSPSGGLLATADSSDNKISMFTVGSGGALATSAPP